MSESATAIRPTFAGVWMTRRAPLAYRVLPKCGCSSIGQVLHHLDYGAYFPRLIHDPAAPFPQWGDATADAEIARRLAAGGVVSFTLARNPYRRLLSAFADKICGFQPDGYRYTGGYIHQKLAHYGLNWRPRCNIVDNFHIFVRFVADTIEHQVPMEPDPHWAPLTDHLRHSAAVNPAWRLQFVGHVEHFARDLRRVFELAGIEAERLPGRVPRENATALPEIAMARWYGAREVEVMTRIYADDFRLLGYGTDPDQTQPACPIDVAAVNRAIGAPA